MSVLNPASDDESPECPLCMEFLELDDISFYPCACGYQVRFAIVSKSGGGCSPPGPAADSAPSSLLAGDLEKLLRLFAPATSTF